MESKIAGSRIVADLTYSSPRYAGFSFTFGRVNVFLGANGCGKSKLLMEIKDGAHSLTKGGKAVYIEGGRTIQIQDVLQVNHTNFAQFDRYESALGHYEQKRTQLLANRVFDALLVLDKQDSHLRAHHSNAVVEWHQRGMKTPFPVRRQPPLERLFELFNEIFPQIKLSYHSDNRQLTAGKNGAQYGPSGFSDGEKQVFSILADLIELNETHHLIVVDEPELNLHPELAERVWTLIENEFPQKYFIYATHSISFALRENVKNVYVLASDSTNITVFNGLESLPRVEVNAFLGGLPGILSANRVLVTEGHEKSFDAIFYRWLLNDEKLEIYPAGGCADVVSITEKRGLWDKISSRISMIGVIDSDYRDDGYLNSLASTAVHVLPLHEAESFLCVPEVLCKIAERIGSQEPVVTEDEVCSLIIEKLENDRLMIAARQAFAQSKIGLAVSVERKLMAAAADQTALVSAIRHAAEEEVKKVEAIGPDQVEQAFKIALATIDQVITSKNALNALRLLPGKELLAQLSSRAGCKNGADLMRSLRKNFSPNDFPMLKVLSARLQPPSIA